MAFTKLYLTANAAPYTPATLRGAWDQTAGAVTARAFDTQKFNGGTITSIGIAETNAAANFDVLLGRWVSGPLAAQTLSGTVDVVLGVLESAAAADLAFHIHIYVTQGDTDTVRGTLLTDYVETTGNEWPTTATGRALAAAQTLTNIGAITAGDRMVVEIGYVALNASATSYTGTLRYGTETGGVPADDLTAGSTSVTTLAGFLTFSVSITEATNPLRESQAGVEVLADGAASLRHSQSAIEVLADGAESLRHSQTAVEVLWEYVPTGSIQIIPWTTAQNLGNSTAATYWHDIMKGGNTAAQGSYDAAVNVIATAGVFRNFDIQIATAPGVGSTYTWTLYVNGVATALTASIVGTATTTRITGVDVTVAAGDVICLRQIVTGIDATYCVGYRGSIEFQSTVDGVSIYGGGLGWPAPGETRYDGVFRLSSGNIYGGLTTVGPARHPVAAPGTLTASYGRAASAPAGGNGITVYINKNGVRQDGTGGTVNTALSMIGVASANVSYSLPLAAGDLVYIEIVGTATVGFIYHSLGFKFVAAVAGQCNVIAHRNDFGAYDTTTYYAVPAVDYGNLATESNYGISARGGPTTFTLRQPRYYLSTAPGAGNSRVLTLRVNAANTLVTTTIADTATTGYSGQSAEIVDTNLYAIQQYGTSTPDAAADASWAYIIDTGEALPGGGGEGPTGINPTPGIVPSDAPEVFVVLTLNGVDYPFGQGQLNDDPSWYGGEKKSKLLDVSSIKYQLTKEGGPQSVSFTVTLLDGDRVFHTRAGGSGISNQIKGGYCAVYVIDHDDRLAQLVPKRIGAGYITKFEGGDNFVFKLTVKDALSVRLAKIDKEPILPPGRFSLTDFPILDPSSEGRAIPLVLGRVADEDVAVPQGEVPPIFVGQINLQQINGLGISMLTDVYIWAQGAFVNDGIRAVFYNPLATPNLRVQTPSAAFGDVGWTPFWPGWTAGTGLSTNYADYNGRRYTPLYIRASYPEATAMREGKILVAANIYGTESVGDTTGLMIDSPAYLTTFLLNAYVFNKYLTGTYPSIPTYTPVMGGAYSWIDTTTFDTVETYFHSRIIYFGYAAGMLLGADGQAITVSQFLADMCAGVWMDIGINLDGQVIGSVRDPLSAPTATFNALLDIEEGSYTVTLNEQRLINRVEYEYAKYYLPPYAPSPTPAEGDPVPAKPTPQYGEYRSGLKILENTTSQTNTGVIQTYVLQNKVIRRAAEANDVAARILEDGLGPNGYGPHEFSLRGGWHLLTGVSLGKNINVSHPAKFGTTTLYDVCRVTGIDIYPMQHRVILSGDVLVQSGTVV